VQLSETATVTDPASFVADQGFPELRNVVLAEGVDGKELIGLIHLHSALFGRAFVWEMPYFLRWCIMDATVPKGPGSGGSAGSTLEAAKPAFQRKSSDSKLGESSLCRAST
jgi:hypothetical protein